MKNRFKFLLLGFLASSMLCSAEVIYLRDGIRQGGPSGGTTINATTDVEVAEITATVININDEPYSDQWNESLRVPTQNAIYDKLKTVGGFSFVETGGAEFTLPLADIADIVTIQGETSFGSTYGPFTMFFKATENFTAKKTVHRTAYGDHATAYGMYWRDLGSNTVVDVDDFSSAMATNALLGTSTGTHPVFSNEIHDNSLLIWSHANLEFLNGHIYALTIVKNPDSGTNSNDWNEAVATIIGSSYPESSQLQPVATATSGGKAASYFRHTDWGSDQSLGIWRHDDRVGNVVLELVSDTDDHSQVSELVLDPTIIGSYDDNDLQLNLAANPPLVVVGDGISVDQTNRFTTTLPANQYTQISGTSDTLWLVWEARNAVEWKGVNIGNIFGTPWEVTVTDISGGIEYATGENLVAGSSYAYSQVYFDSSFETVPDQLYLVKGVRPTPSSNWRAMKCYTGFLVNGINVNWIYHSWTAGLQSETDPAFYARAANVGAPMWSPIIGNVGGEPTIQIVAGDGLNIDNSGTVATITRNLTFQAQPDDPADDSAIDWYSNGTGYGDEGDHCEIINVGGVLKTNTITDYSALP